MKRMALAALVLILMSGPCLWAQRKGGAAAPTGDIEVTRAATLRILITADPTKTFDYLSDSKQLEAWFPDQAIFEPQLGGRYHFRWDDKQGVWSGRVTYFIRGNTLAYTWLPPQEEYETNVQFKLTPQGDQTLVELTHSGFSSNTAMDKAVQAWTFYLQNLKSVIETGVDLRQQMRRGTARPAHRQD